MGMTLKTSFTRKTINFLCKLYVQVIIAIFAGGIIGYLYPQFGIDMKPLADGFIKLIKMMVGAIIFCTVVTGIAAMDNMKQAGRVGVKAMLYFAILSFFSLVIGLVVANVMQPGAGMNIDASTLSTKGVENYIGGGKPKIESLPEFILHIIPTSLLSAFAGNEVLQVLFVSLLFAGAVVVMGKKAQPVVSLIENISHVLFTIIGFIMKVAPIGAFGAMAFTVGQYGIASLVPLAKLMLCFYITCAVFIFVVLAGILSFTGLNIFRFLSYIKEEIFIVFGTSSSETVLPRMLEKLTALGCQKSVVGMVLPTGYSFNLDGTAIYLTMAAIFLAQATNTPMGLQEELILIGVMMLTAKGAAGIVGTAFVALAATLSSIGHIPVAALAIILGIDRFMSEGRAVTNLIGNGVATLFIAKWEGALDIKKAKSILAKKKKVHLETDLNS